MQVQGHRLKDAEFRAIRHFGDEIVPKFIVIHYTAGGSLDGSHRALENAGLSAHVLLERDGTIVQTVDFNRKAYHAGKSFWKGFRSLNSSSIGIEVCNYGWMQQRGDGKFQRTARFGATPVFEPDQVILADHKNGWPRNMGWEIYAPEQLQALAELCEALLVSYQTILEIVGHDDISPERKQDPGPAFPMDSLQVLTENREETSLGRAYEVTARGGLNVRAGPGRDYNVVSVLQFGKTVTVVDDSGSWFPVDLQNDGAVDGFVHSGFMRVA